jgi:hypothetical protein
MKNNSLSFAEILSSNLTTVQAQCWDWKQPPIFGSLVAIETNNTTIFGIISNIVIESSDPIRQPIAYKKTHEQLLQEQPQIFEFLQTNFDAIIVGYEDKEQIRYHLPSSPPQIHSFVSQPSKEKAQAFFKNSDFLNLLAQQTEATPNFHELLFAIIKQTKEQQLVTLTEMEQLLKAITVLLKADYTAIKTFINRAETLLT